MIDVSQWRASIGLWNYCQAASSRPANGCHSYTIKIGKKSCSTTSRAKTSKLPVALSLIAFLLLFFHSLSLSRDTKLKFIPLTSITSYNHVQCTTVTGISHLQSGTEGSSFYIANNLSHFIILLLSGDIELNPGPMIEEARKKIKDILRSNYDTIENATRSSLHKIASQLYAKNIITEIQESTNYRSIIQQFNARVAVTKHVSELKLLCELFLKCICQGGPTDDIVEKLADEWNEVFDTKLLLPGQMTIPTRIPSLTPSPSPFSLAGPAGSTGLVKQVSLSNNKVAERKVQKSLDDLHKKFSTLITELQEVLSEKTRQNTGLTIKISRWVKTYIHWEPITIIESSLDDIFEKIDPYYDFIDCKLILDMSEAFLRDQQTSYAIADEINSHYLKAKALCHSATIKNLKKALKNKYEPFETDIHNMPLIRITLQNDWEDISIQGLRLLIKKLLPIESRQSLMKYIFIRHGSVYITYPVLHCKADNLIEYTQRKLEFIRLIGIFSLHIDDHPVLQKDENTNFTFELALLEAVKAGNNEAVEFLLQLETVNINHTNEEGKTALMLACKGGHEDIVHSLLSTGADVNIQDNKGWTALMIASEQNHISIIKTLLQANAIFDLRTSNGSNALIIASYQGHCEVAQLFINKKVDCKYQREDGSTALMQACANGHTQIVELLLMEQVDPNVQEKDGVNAFMLACRNGHTQIVELLLKEQVDLYVQNKEGWNAFMLACENGHTQIVELLLQKQVDPNVQKKDGVNALMRACASGHTQIVELLLKEQVDPNVQEKDGGNAFMLACKNGHTQIVELLLQKQVNPNLQEKDGGNAFMLACQYGHTQIVELLLKKQVDHNVQKKDGVNAFMLACKFGHTKIVEILLEKKVDPNVKEKDDWNAFMFACKNGYTQIVELLLKEQVDPNVQEKDGWNAFMWACENGHTQIVELLLKEEASVDYAIKFACKEGDTTLVERLLDAGVDPNLKDSKGYTPLMIASANGHEEIVTLLLSKWKANPNIRATDGYDALTLAKNRDIAYSLRSHLRKHSFGSRKQSHSVSSEKSSGGRSTRSSSAGP